MDLTKLKSAYTRNKGLAAVLEMLEPKPGHTRLTDQQQTTVQKIYSTLQRSATPLMKKEIFDILRELERIGSGTLVFGRKGYESRIEWSVPTTSLASLARGERVPETEEVETEEDEDDVDEDEEGETPVPHTRTPSGGTRPHAVAMGGGSVVTHSPQVDKDAPAHRRKGFPANVERTSTLIPHSFALRPDVTVSFWLPSDFRRKEALMLIAFICNITADD